MAQSKSRGSSSGRKSSSRSSKSKSKRSSSKPKGKSSTRAGSRSTSKRSGSRSQSASSGSETSARARGSSAARSAGKRGSGKRDLVKTGTANFFAHRDGEGKFRELDEVGRSLAADRRQKAKTKVASGYGDRGDR